MNSEKTTMGLFRNLNVFSKAAMIELASDQTNVIFSFFPLTFFLSFGETFIKSVPYFSHSRGWAIDMEALFSFK